jgi:aspartyl-tRNA(Asn)/glutamyl-tRNA(Gln) amidotransferase subunit B
VTQYRGGRTATFGFLVGQVMKAAGGKANPTRVTELLRKELDAP